MKPTVARCARVRNQILSFDEGDDFSEPLADHISECLRCQAELARNRRAERGMRQLMDVQFEAPTGLLGSVNAAIDAEEAKADQTNGLSAATVAAAAGALAAAAGTIAVIGWMRTRSVA